MASNYFAKGLKRSALTVALGLSFVGGVQAQTNTAGAVAGRASSGDTITITNPATGFSRTVTVGADGSFRFSALPTGQYQVSRNGAAPRSVTVNVGTSANVDFAAADATTLDTVTVMGTGAVNPIDVSSVESTTILTAEQIAKIPVARDTTSVALLAPGTVKGDAAYGNLASFGGSSVAENQYFINGFNITNAFNNLDFGNVPFEAIAEQQVKTGGYGAEFGRSTGGVINQITKRGTNEFHAGGNIFYNPSSLRSKNPNVYTNAGFNPSTGNVQPSFLFSDNSKDDAGDAYTATVWASGALIKDKLFAYGLLQYGRRTGIESYGAAWALNTRADVLTNSSSSSKSPNWLLKLDWNISDNHLLELTAFGDKTKGERDVYANPSSRDRRGTSSVADDIWVAGNALQRGAYKGTFFTEVGGNSYALKYTGYLTDNFTLSALYGQGKNSRYERGVYANGVEAIYDGNLATGAGGCPSVSDLSGLGLLTSRGIVPCNFFGSIGSVNNRDKRDQFRVDAEWSLGDHLIRFGVDYDKFTSFDATDSEGGAQWYLLSATTAEAVIFRNGAEVEVDSKAFYLEDSWNITDNFIAYGGLRWDSFKNKNGNGQTFVEIKNQFAPRLGFSWDVFGDSTFKVFGNAGRYALPLTATVAIRGASASIYADNIYSYSGLDPVTGAPLNTTLLEAHYLNGENGQPKDPRVVATQGLKPQYQDEYILGFQAQLTDHISGGVRGVYRDLKSAIDDFCDYRYSAQVATDRGLSFDPSNYVYCHLYNPGKDSTFFSDLDGDGTLEEFDVPANYYATLRKDPYDPNSGLLFTPEQIAALDKATQAKRTYKAVEFFFEGHWDKFFVQGSYTWSKSSGTFEGGVKSDIGQDDTGTTQDFDYPELQMGAAGYLPNDRRHSFKLFGNYEINDEWSAGFNFLVQSGRPQSCLGIYGDDPTGYRNSYFSCDTGLGVPSWGGRVNNGTTQGNRGDYGRTPWMRNLDLNMAYSPNWAKGLTMKVDVFNVLNEHTPLSVWERGESRTGLPMYDTHLIPTSFQSPRSVRFMVQYEF